MKKKTGFWVAAVALLLILSLAAMWLVGSAGEGGTALVRVNGETRYTIDLSAVEEPYTLTIAGEHGENVISVERGRIRVSSADCPDRVCVKQGWISTSAVPVVCLPHALVIEIVGGGEGPDSVTQ